MKNVGIYFNKNGILGKYQILLVGESRDFVISRLALEKIKLLNF
jgi:hypothetical protein